MCLSVAEHLFLFSNPEEEIANYRGSRSLCRKIYWDYAVVGNLKKVSFAYLSIKNGRFTLLQLKRRIFVTFEQHKELLWESFEIYMIPLKVEIMVKTLRYIFSKD